MKTYKLKIILILIIITFCSLAAYFSSNSYSNFKRKIPKIDSEELYLVTKVLDGDTFQIKIDKQIQTIRMLGIDTPETVDPRKAPQCFGREASDKTKELLNKHSVRLGIDQTQTVLDKFGRIIAYVYRDDDLFINQYLLEYGYAREYTYNLKYEKQKDFKELEKKAKKEKLGLWGSVCLKK